MTTLGQVTTPEAQAVYAAVGRVVRRALKRDIDEQDVFTGLVMSVSAFVTLYSPPGSADKNLEVVISVLRDLHQIHQSRAEAPPAAQNDTVQ